MLTNKLIRTGFIIIISGWLAACSSSSSSDGDNGGTGAIAIELRDMNGAWNTACLVDGATSVVLVFTFDNGSATGSLTTYADVVCRAVMMVETETSTYVLGTAVTVDGSVAGITSATQVDITDTTVGSPDFGELDFDLIAILGKQLYVGNTDGANGGSTAALRPTQLDGDIVFTKQ